MFDQGHGRKTMKVAQSGRPRDAEQLNGLGRRDAPDAAQVFDEPLGRIA